MSEDIKFDDDRLLAMVEKDRARRDAEDAKVTRLMNAVRSAGLDSFESIQVGETTGEYKVTLYGEAAKAVILAGGPPVEPAASPDLAPHVGGYRTAPMVVREAEPGWWKRHRSGILNGAYSGLNCSLGGAAGQLFVQGRIAWAIGAVAIVAASIAARVWYERRAARR